MQQGLCEIWLAVSGKIAVMIDKIQAMYREKGYLRTDVDFQMDRAGADSSNYVDVSIVINEGKKYKIKSINIEGNENILR